MTPSPERYLCLDAWRGLAALAVLVFHCGNTIVQPESFFGSVLLSGWLGVFIFFPVSGYCILAALHSPENRTVRGFLTRRWRRIMPPYWASILFAVGIGLAALPFNRGSAADFALPAPTWASVLTLTQVFTSSSNAINPVYWSLCYEEQFYLVMALMLVAPASRRPVLLAALTAAAAVYVSPLWLWRVQGIFLEFWMCFATGCAAYLWLHDRSSRVWAALIFAGAAVTGAASANVALLISLSTAIALTALARFDRRLAETWPVSMLMAVGAFSFSLYLVHVPVGGRVTNVLDRVGLHVWLVVAVSCAASLGTAWLFYVAVERRALKRRRAIVAAIEQPAMSAA